MPQERYSRGYLPHIEAERKSQFITWRLADSLPLEVVKQWEEELGDFSYSDSKREVQRRIEAFADTGHGSQLLRNPVFAKIVQDSLIFGHQRLYTLHRWVVMPTHVHVLIRPEKHATLGRIMSDLKGFTSKQIGKALGQKGPLWQADYFDRWIRSEAHFERVASYIEWNPVKAELCEDPTLWPFSSAHPAAWERVCKLEAAPSH